MRVLVIGANGQIGRQVVARLDLEEDVHVRAMVRAEDQREALQALGAEVVIGDLVGAFEHALEGMHAVVFSAGSGASTGLDKTLLVDLWGAHRAIRATEASAATRFVMVSSMGTRDPLQGPSALQPYLVAKRAADDYLLASSLDFTVVRPGMLTDDDPTGHVSVGAVLPPGSVPRADVAQVVAQCAVRGAASGSMFELTSGEVPVAEAVAALQAPPGA